MRRVALKAAVVGITLTGGRGVADEPKIPPGLLTVAEASGFTKTSSSAEADDLVTTLCAKSPNMQGFVFGKTVLGKEMVCVKVSGPEPAPDPLVLLVIGNIHSGECAGKEALLMLLREIALDPGHPWISDDVVLLVAPNYNADGNDDMGPNDERRRGQIGPERMGNRPSSRATP